MPTSYTQRSCKDHELWPPLKSMQKKQKTKNLSMHSLCYLLPIGVSWSPEEKPRFQHYLKSPCEPANSHSGCCSTGCLGQLAHAAMTEPKELSFQVPGFMVHTRSPSTVCVCVVHQRYQHRVLKAGKSGVQCHKTLFQNVERIANV